MYVCVFLLNHFCHTCLFVDVLDTLEDILPSLQEDNITVWCMKAQISLPGVHSLLEKIQQVSDEPVSSDLRSVSCLKTPTLYIFTSGTTGMCFHSS